MWDIDSIYNEQRDLDAERYDAYPPVYDDRSPAPETVKEATDWGDDYPELWDDGFDCD